MSSVCEKEDPSWINYYQIESFSVLFVSRDSLTVRRGAKKKEWRPARYNATIREIPPIRKPLAWRQINYLTSQIDVTHHHNLTSEACSGRQSCRKSTTTLKFHVRNTRYFNDDAKIWRQKHTSVRHVMTIDCSFGLGYLPIMWSVFTLMAFLTSYTMSVLVGHVYPILPSISDTGSKIPEANVFSLLMNVSIILALANYSTRWELLDPFYNKQALNKNNHKRGNCARKSHTVFNLFFLVNPASLHSSSKKTGGRFIKSLKLFENVEYFNWNSWIGSNLIISELSTTVIYGRLRRAQLTHHLLYDPTDSDTIISTILSGP